MRIFTLCFILFFTISYAHPGKTDNNGGHYDKSIGEYHYHHGYPAHTMCGINCPYNNIDATNHNSSNSSNTSNYKKSKTAETENQDNQASFWDKFLVSVLLSYFTYPFTALLTGWVLSKFKNIYQKFEDYIWILGYIESVLILYFLF